MKYLYSKFTLSFIVLAVFISARVNAQIVACPTVDAGPDVNLTCGNNCTTLNATYINVGSTTSYSVAPIAYNPITAYTNGTPIIANTDDIYSGIVPLPFPFCFFGTTYTNVVVGSNGIITFDLTAANLFCNWSLAAAIPIPTAVYGVGTTNCIMAPYEDIDPTYAGNAIRWEVIDAAPCRKLVINFFNIPYFGDPNSVSTCCCATALWRTSQVVLYETTNVIDIIIQSKYNCTGWNGGLAIEGIQNAGGTVAFAVPGRNNTVFSAFNDAYRFTPNALPSQVSLLWLDQNGNPIGNTPSINVCPATATTYTLNAHYGNCPGATTVDVSDQVTVTPSGTLQSALNTQQNVACFGGNNGAASVIVNVGAPPYTFAWSPSGGNGATASGLSAGNYTCSVTNPSGCVNIIPVTITQPPLLTSNIAAPTNVSCFNGNNGVAIATPGGGTPGYTYLWSPAGGIGATASTLAAGNYTVTVTDVNGCSITSTTTVTQPTVLTALASTLTNVSCFNGNNGLARVNPGGGTGPYTYSWTPTGGTAQTASNLGAGSYTAIVTDANGCTISSTSTITQPTVVTALGSTLTNVSCFNGNNGSVMVTPGGGTGTYTYLWSPGGEAVQTATNLSAGAYTVTVTDANGCTISSTATIVQPTVVTATGSTVTNTSCFSGSNGSAMVTPGGGVGPYTYLWSPTGGNGITASNLIAGTYTVTVTDSHNCSITSTATITQPTALTAAGSTVTNVLCNSGNNGSVTVTPGSGTPGYTYLWSASAQTGQTATGLAVGTYTVTVTDANGCTITATATVTQPSLLAAVGNTIANVSCNGGANGSVTATPSNGTPGYTYLWNPSVQTGQTASNLAAGTYTVTVTDANGCTITTTSTITQPPLLTSAINTHTDILCNAGNNGAATVTPNGGNGTYTYAWNTVPVQTSATANNLTAGTYSVVITDANGCTSTTGVTITEPPLLTSAITAQTNILCFGGNNGTATVTPNGGTGIYTYAWNTAPVQMTASANNLTAGTYSVIVADANGCTSTQGVTLTEPTAVTANATTLNNVSCSNSTDGIAMVTPGGGVGGYNYLWSPSGGNGVTASGLPANTYTVTVTDGNGCSLTTTTVITQTNPVTANISPPTNVTCNGGNDGQAIVVAGGGNPGYIYLWSPIGGNAANASNLTAGTYTVTVTDANGCTETATTIVTEPPLLTSNINTHTDVLCSAGNNGSATVTTAGGTGIPVYSWNTVPVQTSATATNLTAGNYTVTVTDANGCSTTSSIVITEPPLLTSAISASTDVSCNGGNNGSAIVNAAGGTGVYTYSWLPSGGNTATANNLAANTYTVVVADANGCFTATSVVITEPTLLTSNVTAHTDVLCNGGNNGDATVTPAGGTGIPTYSWNTFPVQTGATATGLTTGNYTVTVTDGNGCTTSASIIITEPPLLTSNITAQTNILCNGGNNGDATVTVGGGAGVPTYSWNTVPVQNTATATNLTAGSYTVTVTDGNGCTTSSLVTITEPPILTSAINTHTDVLCAGGNNGSATVTIGGGAGSETYSWNTTPVQTTATATNLTVGNYTVTVTDGNGCTTSASVSITEPIVLAAVMNPSVSVTCNGGSDGSATVVANGGTIPYNYLWTPAGGNNDIATNLTAGNYSVTITDANGCTVIQTATVTEPTPVTLSVNGASTICQAQCATITAIPGGGITPYTYAWDNGATTVSQMVCPTSGTIYTVTVSDANGCSVTQSVTISVNPVLNVSASSTPQICAGSSGTVSSNAGGGNGGPYQYTWNTGQTTASFSANPSVTTTYTVTINDGCSPPVQTTTTIIVNPIPVANFTPLNAEACIPISVDFTSDTTSSIPGSTYLWTLGDGTTSTDPNPSHVYPNPGQYSVSLIVTSPAGCTNNIAMVDVVTADAIPIADFISADEVIIDGTVAPVNVTNTSSGSSSWQWYFGDNSGIDTSFSPSHLYSDTGTYTIQLISTSPAGCIDTTYRVIRVDGIFALFIPNSFTPNGDGINDTFNAFGMYVKDFDMWILDRWGGKIYHSTSLSNPWDGTYFDNRTLCQNGVYVYKIKARGFDDKVHEFVGSVTLVR